MKKSSQASKLLWIFLFIAFIASTVSADETTDKVDKLFSKWDSTVSPGAALAIIKDGEIIYKRGYGMANLEHNVPIIPTSVFRIGSTSKQFTASCIAILALQAKISLDDDIRKYIPELPKYERPITIRHLLHHTSGIRDYLTLGAIAALPDDQFYTPEDSVELLSRQKGLNFLPGEEHLYSNSGYFLLGVIVERVSGKSLNDFAQAHIFKPLGMKNTHFHDDHTMVVKNRADGYSPQKKGFRIDMTTLDHVGDGGVFTTVEDLFLWDQSFYNYKLGKELIDLIQTPGMLNSGKKLDYAFGLSVTEYKGLKKVSHGGGFVGFRAQMARFPEQKFTVICLANLGTINPSRLCNQVADIYLADKLKEAPKAPKEKKKVKAVALSKQELEDKVGNYQDERTGTWTIISIKEGKLIMQARGNKFDLTPVSKTRFKALEAPFDNLIEFFPDAKGRIRKAKVTMEGRDDINLVKSSLVSPLTPAQLKEYAGEYFNDELPVTYKLALEKESLFFKHKNAPKGALKAMDRDKFTMRWFNIEFVRDKRNRIKGFILAAGRAANIEFVKK
ncbi:MAG: serine hydrolase [Candidatus Aminicenantes bacterium]|nr:serine hydrolase [Candidatus Aminicenantes bacterium]